MKKVVLVQGTRGWSERWWQDRSPFVRFLAQHGIAPARVMRRPFRWTTAVDGWRFWERWFGSADDHRDWEACGDALTYFLAGLRYADRNVIAHSHGGQGAFYTAARGPRIRVLITVGTPARADMQAIIAAARPNIGTWWHICDRAFDLWGHAGELGDGAVSLDRTFVAADRNITLPRIGHTGVLTNERLFHHWIDEGAIALLKEPAHG